MLVCGYLKNAQTADPPASTIPAELAQLLRSARDTGFDEDALETLSSFISASFVSSNLRELEPLLSSLEDIDGQDISVYRAWFPDHSRLPCVRVQASFDVPFRDPPTDETLERWQDDNDAFLTDCISFWWTFADPADDWNGVFDCEEAGAHLEEP